MRRIAGLGIKYTGEISLTPKPVTTVSNAGVVRWSNFGTVNSDAAGEFSFTDAGAPSAATRFYRARN